MSATSHQPPSPQPPPDAAPPFLVAGVLSRAHNERQRCLQRATLLSLVQRVPDRTSSDAPRGWMPLTGGGALLLRYIVSVPRNSTTTTTVEAAAASDNAQPQRGVASNDWLRRALEHDPSSQTLSLLIDEWRTHGDLLATHTPDGSAGCGEKVLWALRHLALVLAPRSQFVLIADDDAFLHPVRLAQDLIPFVGWPQEVIYGQVSLAAGWDDTQMKHYGYGNGARHFERLVDEWTQHNEQLNTTGLGPFFFPIGFMAAFSSSLARDMALVPTVRQTLRRLRERWAGATSPTANRRRRRLRSRPNKCNPATDATMGWAAAQVGRRLTIVDITSAGRMDLWRSKNSAGLAHARLSVMHGASSWPFHWKWALCKSGRLGESFPNSTLGDKERAFLTPSGKCRSCPENADERPLLRCKEMQCGSPTRCRGCSEKHRACFGHVNATFAGWQMCDAYTTGDSLAPSPIHPTFVAAPRAELADRSICFADEAEVLQSCARGFETGQAGGLAILKPRSVLR